MCFDDLGRFLMIFDDFVDDVFMTFAWFLMELENAGGQKSQDFANIEI